MGGLRRAFVAGCRAAHEEGVVRRLLRSLLNCGNVANEDGSPAGDADHNLTDFGSALEELARLDEEFLVPPAEAPGGELLVRLLQPLGDDKGREVEAAEAGGVERALELSALPADERCLRDVGDLFDLPLHLGGNAPQLVVVIPLAVERESQDRHVVDAARLDQRLRHALRDPVEVGEHLVVRADDGLLFVGADVEPGDCHAHPGARGRVDVLHARDLP